MNVFGRYTEKPNFLQNSEILGINYENNNALIMIIMMALRIHKLQQGREKRAQKQADHCSRCCQWASCSPGPCHPGPLARILTARSYTLCGKIYTYRTQFLICVHIVRHQNPRTGSPSISNGTWCINIPAPFPWVGRLWVVCLSAALRVPQHD